MPDIFALIIDGLSKWSTNFYAVFATYPFADKLYQSALIGFQRF